jgi:hypothetical protein
MSVLFGLMVETSDFVFIPELCCFCSGVEICTYIGGRVSDLLSGRKVATRNNYTNSEF